MVNITRFNPHIFMNKSEMTLNKVKLQLVILLINSKRERGESHCARIFVFAFMSFKMVVILHERSNYKLLKS